jgi:hypothetical protein
MPYTSVLKTNSLRHRGRAEEPIEDQGMLLLEEDRLYMKRLFHDDMLMGIDPQATGAPPTGAPPTVAPPTAAPPTEMSPMGAPLTATPPTEKPPTSATPTVAPPTEAQPTAAPPTEAPTTVPSPTTRAPTQRHQIFQAFAVISAFEVAMFALSYVAVINSVAKQKWTQVCADVFQKKYCCRKSIRLAGLVPAIIGYNHQVIDRQATKLVALPNELGTRRAYASRAIFNLFLLSSMSFGMGQPKCYNLFVTSR